MFLRQHLGDRVEGQAGADLAARFVAGRGERDDAQQHEGVPGQGQVDIVYERGDARGGVEGAAGRARLAVDVDGLARAMPPCAICSFPEKFVSDQ